MEKLHTLQDQITVFEQLPPPVYLVKDLFLQPSLNLIIAPSNSGKTLLCTYLYLCFEGQGNFMELPTLPQKTMYMDLEMSSTMFFIRIRKQSKKKEFSNSLFYTNEKIDILDDSALNKFIKLLKEYAITTLIIDSYSQLTVGTEENSNSQQAILLSQLYKFRNEGITLFLIHHTRKEAQGQLNMNSIRGGSVIAGAADCILLLTRQGTVMRLKQLKDRLIPSDLWLDKTFQFKTNEEGILIPILMDDSNLDNTLSAQIIEILKQHGELSGNKICELTKSNRQAISNELKKLVEISAIKQIPETPRQGQRVRYKLGAHDSTTEIIDADDENDL